MPSLADRLRGLFSPNRASDRLTGVFRTGFGTTYSATGWDFTRIANVVYGNPTGYRCVEAIANNFSRPEWLVKQPGDDGEELTDHPMRGTLDRPDPRTSGTMMQRSMGRDLELCGKSFWTKMQGADGFGVVGPVSGLRRLPAQRVTVVGNQDDELVGFIYNDRSGRQIPILPESIVYLRYPHPERVHDGLAPAVVAGLPAEADQAAARFNYELLSSDAALPGYLVVEGLTPTQFEEWKARWEAGEVPGKTRFLGGQNASYVKVGQSNKDLMYDAMRDGSQRDIMKAFGVPAAVAFDTGRQTYENAEHERVLFMQQNILPKWALIADELTIQLGEEAGVEIAFNTEGIEELQESQDAVVERTVKLLGAEATYINEVRRDVLNKDPVPWGDEPVAPLRLMRPSPALPGVGVAPPEAPTSAGLTTWQRAAGVHPPFHRHVSTWEGRAQRIMERFFARQGKAVAARFESMGKVALPRSEAAVEKKPPAWWDAERWKAELDEDLAHFYADLVDAFGTLTADRLLRDFNISEARVRAYIEGRRTNVAGLVNDTTEAALRALVADRANAGDSIAKIADAIRGYFNDQGQSRAETFARTEVIGGANFASVEAARQSGIVTAKTWMAAADDRVDDDCAALDGQTVGIEDTFGEVDQPPLHPNCRCTVEFVISDATSDLPTAASLSRLLTSASGAAIGLETEVADLTHGFERTLRVLEGMATAKPPRRNVQIDRDSNGIITGIREVAD